MTPSEALRHLGTSRVIWIDDQFDRTAEQLGKLLVEKPAIARRCGFPELRDTFAKCEFDDDGAVVDADGFEFEVIQALTDASESRRDEINQIYLAAERSSEGSPVPEMTTETIRAACQLLAVSESDRWSFEGVEQRVRQAITGYSGGDDEVSYIIDLKDDRSPGLNNRRGLEILKVLAGEGSRATAFVLTHETTSKAEAELERELVLQLDEAADKFPFCVVSKESLIGNSVEIGRLEETFVIAIKRAGLRRSVFEALSVVEPVVIKSLAEAKRRLLRIPPERLNQYVVEVGYLEGLSELHVIERALTAHMAFDIRQLFGSNGRIRASNERVRHLRDIRLPLANGLVDDDLIHFRNAETWEPEALINSSFSPIACGDVFEVEDVNERPKISVRKRFVVLSQACDLQIRHDGERTARTAILAPLKYRDTDSGAVQDKLHECLVPCRLEGQTVICDLRNATPVSLAILDLASFRDDGRVRFDSGQVQPDALLPGQRIVYRNRTEWLSEHIASSKGAGEGPGGVGADPATVCVPEPGREGQAVAAERVHHLASVDAGGTVVNISPVNAQIDPVKIARAEKRIREAEKKRLGAFRRSEENKEELARKTAEERSRIARSLQLAFMAPEEFRVVEAGGYKAAK